jgi:hypothetical protein
MVGSSGRGTNPNSGQRNHAAELQAKYEGYCDWTDRGIIADLARHHGIQRPSLALLRMIAACIAELLQDSGVVLDREERRSKSLLTGWFNFHYDAIGPIIPNVVICDEGGQLAGPRADQYKQFCRNNPDHPAIRYLERGGKSVVDSRGS